MADPEAKDAYPIVTYTWQLVNKKYEKGKLAGLQGLLKYGLTQGQQDAEPPGYIPMPAPVIKKVKAAIETLTAS